MDNPTSSRHQSENTPNGSRSETDDSELGVPAALPIDFALLDGEIIEGEIIDELDDDLELPPDIVDAELVDEAEVAAETAKETAKETVEFSAVPPRPPSYPKAVDRDSATVGRRPPSPDDSDKIGSPVRAYGSPPRATIPSAPASEASAKIPTVRPSASKPPVPDAATTAPVAAAATPPKVVAGQPAPPKATTPSEGPQPPVGTRVAARLRNVRESPDSADATTPTGSTAVAPPAPSPSESVVAETFVNQNQTPLVINADRVTEQASMPPRPSAPTAVSRTAPSSPPVTPAIPAIPPDPAQSATPEAFDPRHDLSQDEHEHGGHDEHDEHGGHDVGQSDEDERGGFGSGHQPPTDPQFAADEQESAPDGTTISLDELPSPQAAPVDYPDELDPDELDPDELDPDELDPDELDRDELGADQRVPEAELADESERPVIELRQIAGLTSGSVMELLRDTYDFTESSDIVGFSIVVDEHDRVVVVPGSVPASIDAVPIDEPTLLGSAVLDVGTARFVARTRRDQPTPGAWLEQHSDADEPDPKIAVPADLVGVQPEERRRRLRRRRNKDGSGGANDVANWEFMETIREARAKVAARERYHHPDPTELAMRIAMNAPTIGTRPYGHPLFATASVLCADVPWLPDFDDIRAIPESVGFQLQPLLSLPSVPVVADLMVGPLGIVGPRTAAMACARHLLVSLYAASTDDLRLHVLTSTSRRDVWEWCRGIAPAAPLALSDHEQSVVLIDGMELYAGAGFEHEDAIERRVSVVILADAVDQLPSYCGTVLQISETSTGILTDHRGDVIHGSPIGISTPVATDLVADLVPLVRSRQR